ncbi:MAG: hypothetical protein NC489_38665 [Ruminococcus flavefaciens]|nr:hypothetical protein [Ruminococcus flavefaciens]
MKELTILTEPVQCYYIIKIAAKKLLIKNYKYGGHATVTRSLIEGLDKIGYTAYNYRPYKEKDIAEHVHVLAGIETLRYAIDLKKKGKIKYLTAGPNVVVFSTDAESIIADENIDLYLQPSQWAADFHIELNSALKNRCVAWAAGVDLDKLESRKYLCKRKQVLIYHKDESEQFCYRVDFILRKHGYNTVILKYGNYRFDDYVKLLGESEFMVVISRQESQGIYLAEAWAMNVPTICFEPHYYKWNYDYMTVEKEGNISTCPYLTKETGVTFAEMKELDNIVSDIDKLLTGVHPREWVINNMSDEICAKHFLKLIMNKEV